MTNLVNTSGHRKGTQHPTSSTTMAPKTHGAHRAGGGLTRTHSRGSSGGGSKLGLSELRLTQKEPPPPRYPDKPRKNSHLHLEVCSQYAKDHSDVLPVVIAQGNGHGRSSAHIPRTSSSVRVQSKEHVNPSALRRAPAPSSSKQKVGFTISSPSEEPDDEEEWISSESGAATPSHESDVEEVVTPVVEKPKPKLPPNALPNGFAKDDHPTPRADPTALPRIDTVKPANSPVPGPAPISHDYAPPPQAAPSAQPVAKPGPPAAQPASAPPPVPLARIPTPPVPESQLVVRTPSPPSSLQSLPAVTKARSETHSPPRRSPDTRKRPMTRPPSTHSISSSSAAQALRPHPLIRAHSAGYGALLGPAKPAPLAPLTSSEQIPAQIPTTSPTSYRAVSPTFSMQNNTASPVLSQPSPTDSEASKQLRRQSLSSRSSGATAASGHPLHGSASHSQFGKASNHDRQRTMSSSSTFAALSNLNLGMRPAPSPPKTPLQHLVVHFPPADQQAAQLEHVHPLLPPPYINSHLTLLAYRNPLAESYERVTRAKQAQARS
jgi:hypothetical protein